MEFALFVELADARVAYTVKECGLDHCIMDHVFEDNLVAYLERLVEGKVSELVACEARIACEFVCEFLFSRHSRANHFWAVWHFQAVRHVRADRHVQDGNVHFVVNNVSD